MKVKHGFKFKKNGWNYISIKGNPTERGIAHGTLLKEEIKEQGYGTYMQDLKLPSGERLGDISGFDFKKNQVIKKN